MLISSTVQWVDLFMPSGERYANIHSSAQGHVDVENNYDIFDDKNRVIGVASPEHVPQSDLINVSNIRKPTNE